ncbi:hypothetical protein [Desulfosediminicola flagellatus]|uniref:hypothetical protein n=1 Tax=Desulfosediminicola flagellatus TaxID=2569541 RepID=UPI0010AC0B82|nr:hypothetical protein [Desulfosediminicola flagellatus]
MRSKNSISTFFAFVVVAATFLIIQPAHARSQADCAAHADRVARDSTGIMGGAARGAAGGALFGAIVGGNSKGTKRGAALGTVVGGAGGAYNRDEIYKRAYDDCMRGK